MERYEIETFLALAEELHFARTAERLRVSPGRVSQTVKALERRVGGPLFERTSRRVALTPVGRQLRDDLLPAYERMLRAVADAAAAYTDISDTVWVGFTAPWSGELLIRAGDTLSTRYPHCTVELLDVTYNAAIAALREKRVDLLVAEPPVEESDVVVGPVLFSERRALVVPAGHPLARRRTVSLEDLTVLPLVTASGVSKTFHEALFPSRTPDGKPIERGPTAGGWQGVLSLVGAGKGATVATVAAGRYYVRPDIAYVPIDGAAPIEYALMWRDGDLAPGLRVLIEIAAGLAPRAARTSCDCRGAGANRSRQCQRCSGPDQ
ncbi:LysR family transcriptional regulator [Streptomyces drozdowiczii]|uniref:LysR family transcriptional regulator n=2 Tax=Streptomyces drozdowiczii TaxID=202862 RepID=A0ABY6Q037_9ACTN|nr:LysR family transcriptional regulator [Streptomyces drozdowiczii]MCX0241906.1 LysR family transcriptional regulator [Streptomyces drozdowiczii]UZK52734.1 LysR family transcriptional regulator [Streptomyces drozdowiczii]UZK57982.1 LysR family transcriptional regulator [Streptomyces drozdowiczii]